MEGVPQAQPATAVAFSRQQPVPLGLPPPAPPPPVIVQVPEKPTRRVKLDLPPGPEIGPAPPWADVLKARDRQAESRASDEVRQRILVTVSMVCAAAGISAVVVAVVLAATRRTGIQLAAAAAGALVYFVCMLWALLEVRRRRRLAGGVSHEAPARSRAVRYSAPLRSSGYAFSPRAAPAVRPRSTEPDAAVQRETEPPCEPPPPREPPPPSARSSSPPLRAGLTTARPRAVLFDAGTTGSAWRCAAGLLHAGWPPTPEALRILTDDARGHARPDATQLASAVEWLASAPQPSAQLLVVVAPAAGEGYSLRGSCGREVACVDVLRRLREGLVIWDVPGAVCPLPYVCSLTADGFAWRKERWYAPDAGAVVALTADPRSSSCDEGAFAAAAGGVLHTLSHGPAAVSAILKQLRESLRADGVAACPVVCSNRPFDLRSTCGFGAPLSNPQRRSRSEGVPAVPETPAVPSSAPQPTQTRSAASAQALVTDGGAGVADEALSSVTLPPARTPDDVAELGLSATVPTAVLAPPTTTATARDPDGDVLVIVQPRDAARRRSYATEQFSFAAGSSRGHSPFDEVSKLDGTLSFTGTATVSEAPFDYDDHSSPLSSEAVGLSFTPPRSRRHGAD